MLFMVHSFTIKNVTLVLILIGFFQNILCHQLIQSYDYEIVDNFDSEGQFCLKSEHNKTCCSRNEFQCEDGTCIPLENVCETSNFDRVGIVLWRFYRSKYKLDCKEGSDEISCEDNPCDARNNKCDQKCLDLPQTNKSRCYCFKGYQLDQTHDYRNKYTCKDINECAIGVHSCIHQCLNLNGSFACACSKDFKKILKNNRELCMAEDRNISIFYNSNHCIYMYKLDSHKTEKLVCANRLYSLDYDPVTEILYWSHEFGISRSYIPGAKQGNVTITHPQQLPYSYSQGKIRYNLALDWKLENMYWLEPDILNENSSYIMMSKLDGRYVKTVLNVSRSNNLALNLEQGVFIWSSSNNNSSVISSAWMFQGSFIWKILNIPHGNITAIAYDNLSNGRIYWADASKNAIYYVFRDGRRPTEVVQINDEQFPLSMDIFEEYLYWVTESSCELLRINKFGRGKVELLVSNLIKPSLVKIYHKNKYLNGSSRKLLYCEECSHICFSTDLINYCECPDGSEKKYFQGNVLCLHSQEQPTDLPLDCNCNDKINVCNETSPYKNCSCVDICFNLFDNDRRSKTEEFRLTLFYIIILSITVILVLICCVLSFLKK